MILYLGTVTVSSEERELLKDTMSQVMRACAKASDKFKKVRYSYQSFGEDDSAVIALFADIIGSGDSSSTAMTKYLNDYKAVIFPVLEKEMPNATISLLSEAYATVEAGIVRSKKLHAIMKVMAMLERKMPRGVHMYYVQEQVGLAKIKCACHPVVMRKDVKARVIGMVDDIKRTGIDFTLAKESRKSKK